MADIQTVTTAGATLIVFGSKAKADINPDTDTGKAFWEGNPGAIVFPTDENKVYFGGAAYDGMNFDQLKTLLSENYGLQLAIDNTINTGKERGYYTATEIQVLLRGLQNALTAGTGITITETRDDDGNLTETTIAANPDEIVTATVVEPLLEQSAIVKGIQSQADSAKVESSANKASIAALQTGKQDKLTAGDGISIENNVISSTFDLNVYRIVSTLPTIPSTESEIKEMQKHIYLVVDSTQADTTDTTNKYIEYILVTPSNSSNAVDGAYWEKLGEYKADIDLTPYLKKTELLDSFASETDNNGTKVTVTEDTTTNKVQVKAAIIIQ